jgi:hypothetical protein
MKFFRFEIFSFFAILIFQLDNLFTLCEGHLRILLCLQLSMELDHLICGT